MIHGFYFSRRSSPVVQLSTSTFILWDDDDVNKVSDILTRRLWSKRVRRIFGYYFVYKTKTFIFIFLRLKKTSGEKCSIKLNGASW